MDPAELEALIKLYLAARDQLLNTIIYYRGVGTKVYANTILKQLEKQLKTLEKQSSVFASTAIPKEYRKALDDVYAYFQKNNLQMIPPAVFAQIHDDAIYAVAREMQYQIGQGLEQAGRQVLRYVEAARDNALRTAGLTATGEKLASGSTVAQMKQNLIGMLQDQGFMSVQYGSGNRAYQVSLDSYAGMVARSTTREAGNLARMNQLTANGYDLVKLTEHYPTCDICAQFQGRVYSISGTDKRFPALDTAFRFGYKNIHPSCRHSAAPWIEALQSPEELQEALEKSNAPFEDTRSDQERALYNKQQGQNRQLRQDRYQYERYKARLGTDAPKSFHSFRQVKNAGREAWEDLQYYYKYKGDRPTYCVKIDRDLQKLSLKKGWAYPAKAMDITAWKSHAEERLSTNTKEEAKEWMSSAKVMLVRYPSPHSTFNYYTRDGIIAIKEADGVVQTAIEKARFGKDTESVLEVIDRHVE